MKILSSLFSRLPHFGSDETMSRRHLMPGLLFFIVIIIIDAFIQSNHGGNIGIRLFSKSVFILSAGWLVYINYITGQLPSTLIWLANGVYALLLIISIVFTAAIFDYIAIVVGLVIIASLLGYLAYETFGKV